MQTPQIDEVAAGEVRLASNGVLIHNLMAMRSKAIVIITTASQGQA